MRPVRKALLGVATAALLAGTAACSSDSGSSDAKGNGGDSEAGSGTSARSAFEALTAAARTTDEITSADVVSVSRQGGTEAVLDGSLSWADGVEMTAVMTGDEFGSALGGSGEIDVVWVDGVMYMNLGPQFAAESDGRPWMSMDMVALMEEAGEEGLGAALSTSMDQGAQSPAEQMAMLLESDDVEWIGEEELDGATVNHYKGTLAIEEVYELQGTFDGLSEEERASLLDLLSEQGTEVYELEVWLNEDDFPVKVSQSYDTAMGPAEQETTYSNFGTEVNAEAPPADEVIDFVELMQMLGAGF
ncbi:hypothetical protein N0X72_11680 [Streptomyces carpaticus]|uniref:hypothetical protein n=1 Tax=Streptomyces TaxID=1883 RepID=UPI001FF882E7|nr:hypothetical protein [Streptomyces sp. XM4011]MCK1814008.1 hypothetical protein [Streptomyces sp. XM4011]UWM49624.1 hypothetical protein N0X72_11680 [Streptomyces carpaticus]